MVTDMRSWARATLQTEGMINAPKEASADDQPSTGPTSSPTPCARNTWEICLKVEPLEMPGVPQEGQRRGLEGTEEEGEGGREGRGAEGLERGRREGAGAGGGGGGGRATRGVRMCLGCCMESGTHFSPTVLTVQTVLSPLAQQHACHILRSGAHARVSSIYICACVDRYLYIQI